MYVKEGGNESFRSKELTPGIYPNPLYDLQRDPNKQHATSRCWGLQILGIFSHCSMILEKVLVYFQGKVPSVFPSHQLLYLATKSWDVHVTQTQGKTSASSVVCHLTTMS